MNSIITLLASIFAKVTFAVNKLYDLLQAAITDLQAFATTKANEAKQQAIDAAALDATAKAAQAEANAIAAAATDATNKANAAQAAAIAAAEAYATAQAEAARLAAIATASQDATDKANAAQAAAIAAAALDATTKANNAYAAAQSYADTKAAEAQQAAINAAALDATAKANTAQTTAISTAAADATQKALTALTDANDYTDAAIAGLQNIASMGITNLKRVVRLVTGGSIGSMPSTTALGLSKEEFVVVEVEGTDSNGDTIFDQEFDFEVFGDEVNGQQTSQTISVTTEDRLICQVKKRQDGTFYLVYVRKHEDRLKEAFVRLSGEISAHVSETELNSALTQMETNLVNNIYSILQDPNL